MKAKDRVLIEATLIAVEQYLTTFIFVATHPGARGISALDAARGNMINKIEAFMIEADKR